MTEAPRQCLPDVLVAREQVTRGVEKVVEIKERSGALVPAPVLHQLVHLGRKPRQQLRRGRGQKRLQGVVARLVVPAGNVTSLLSVGFGSPRSRSCPPPAAASQRPPSWSTPRAAASSRRRGVPAREGRAGGTSPRASACTHSDPLGRWIGPRVKVEASLLDQDGCTRSAGLAAARQRDGQSRGRRRPVSGGPARRSPLRSTFSGAIARGRAEECRGQAGRADARGRDNIAPAASFLRGRNGDLFRARRSSREQPAHPAKRLDDFVMRVGAGIEDGFGVAGRLGANLDFHRFAGCAKPAPDPDRGARLTFPLRLLGSHARRAHAAPTQQTPPATPECAASPQSRSPARLR